MSRKITITCVDSGGGHACGLAIGLKKYGQVTAVWKNENKHKLDYLVPDALFGFRYLPFKGDDLVIVSCITYDHLIKHFGERQVHVITNNYKRVHVVITDGRMASNPDYYNARFRRFDVLTTGCKRHFREPYPVRTYYQPFDLSHIDQTKNKKLTIAHSPFGLTKFKEKGTDIIEKASKRYVFDLITNVSWDECLRRKAKAHIFVDQVDHYDKSKFQFKSKDYVWPALGKSGIEAMHLGCLTITYGKGYDTNIPAPPVAWCKEDNFLDVLDYYVRKKRERMKLANRQKAWALEYANYDFAARNVLDI